MEWTCPSIFYSHSWPDWAKYSSLWSENVAAQCSMRSNQGWAGLGWAGLGWAVFVWADYTSLSPAGAGQLVVVVVAAPAGHTFLGRGDTRARGLTTTTTTTTTTTLGPVSWLVLVLDQTPPIHLWSFKLVSFITIRPDVKLAHTSFDVSLICPGWPLRCRLNCGVECSLVPSPGLFISLVWSGSDGGW